MLFKHLINKGRNIIVDIAVDVAVELILNELGNLNFNLALGGKSLFVNDTELYRIGKQVAYILNELLLGQAPLVFNKRLEERHCVATVVFVDVDIKRLLNKILARQRFSRRGKLLNDVAYDHGLNSIYKSSYESFDLVL